jgi:hypothetical protein
VLAQPLGRRLPRQPAHEHLRQRRVAEPRPVVMRPPAPAAAARRRVGRGPTGARGRGRSRHRRAARICCLRLVSPLHFGAVRRRAEGSGLRLLVPRDRCLRAGRAAN